MGSFDLTLFKGTTKSRHELLDGQGYLDVEKGSLVLKIDGIISEFRPGRVGPDSERPKELLEGEFYFATDTNLLYIGSTNKTEPFAVKGFPYHKLVKAPWGEDVFRYMVDPDNGDDANDGLTWATAKKTIGGVLSSLPNDLFGYDVYIGVLPGSYSESIFIPHNNTRIIFEWFGEIFANSNTDYSNFLSNNEIVQTSNDQIFVNGGDDLAFVITGVNTTVKFNSRDDSKNPWQSGWLIGERWRFTTNSAWAVGLSQSRAVLEMYGPRIDLGGSTAYGIEIDGEAHLVAPAFYGGAGNASVQSGRWRGAIAFFSTNQDVSLGTYGGGFGVSSDFPVKVSNGLYFADIKQAITYAAGKNEGNINKSQAMLYEDVQQSFGKCNIYVYSEFDGGTIAYDDRYFNLTVDTKNARTIKNLNTGVTEIYLNNSIKQQGDNLIFDLPTSDPQEAGVLWNDNGTVKVSSG